MKNKFYNLTELILYEDEHYIVLNKPPFFSSLDDRHDQQNMLSLARTYVDSAQLCHRLDKETSGVLVVAKHNEAYRFMAMNFEKRKVRKIYHAVVDGIHEFRNEKIEEPILLLPKGIVRIDKRDGKKSLTIVNTLKAFKKHSLVECEPVTGRMHQIRIHLSSRNAPITGDLEYNGQSFFLSSVKRKYNIGKYEEERPLLNRFALHAASITFVSIDGKKISMKAPYPKDFQALLTQLEKNA
jgi:23S rRNA pseudouridine955/2504/2580 synthase